MSTLGKIIVLLAYGVFLLFVAGSVALSMSAGASGGNADADTFIYLFVFILCTLPLSFFGFAGYLWSKIDTPLAHKRVYYFLISSPAISFLFTLIIAYVLDTL